MDTSDCKDIIMVLNTVQKDNYICASVIGKENQCQIVNVTTKEILRPAVAAMSALDCLSKKLLNDGEMLMRFLEIIRDTLSAHTVTKES